MNWHFIESHIRVVVAAGSDYFGASVIFDVARFLLERVGQVQSGYVDYITSVDPNADFILVHCDKVEMGLAERANTVVTSYRDLRETARALASAGVELDADVVSSIESVVSIHRYWSVLAAADLRYEVDLVNFMSAARSIGTALNLSAEEFDPRTGQIANCFRDLQATDVVEYSAPVNPQRPFDVPIMPTEKLFSLIDFWFDDWLVEHGYEVNSGSIGRGKRYVKAEVTALRETHARLHTELSATQARLIALTAELATVRWQTSTSGSKPARRLGDAVKSRLGVFALRGVRLLRLRSGPLAGTSSKCVVIADRGLVGEVAAARAGSSRIVRLLPGEGLEPDKYKMALRTPAKRSLAGWMLSERAPRVDEVGTFVLEAGDTVGLSLLRGHVKRDQSLLLVRGTRNTDIDPRELGEPTTRTKEGYFYQTFPEPWLDPLNGEWRPDARLVGQIAWPKISLVMVSKNQGQFVEEGLRSILDQDYPNLELVVVDGASNDGTIPILERYRSRIDVLIIEPDSGQSDGLNKGFARASGAILGWLNSDDLLEPGSLYRVAQAFLHHKVDMVVGGCRQIGLSRDQIIRNHHTTLPVGAPTILPFGLLLEFDRLWLGGNFFYQPEVFFSRAIWDRSGGLLRPDLYYLLDYDLWVRMAAAGATVIHIPDYLACSRTHEHQKTTSAMPFLPESRHLLAYYGERLTSVTPLQSRQQR